MNFIEALGKKYSAWMLRNSYDWVNTDHSPKLGMIISVRTYSKCFKKKNVFLAVSQEEYMFF